MFQIAPSILSSIALWVIFAVLVYSVARYAPLWFLPFGHFAVACIIYQMHIVWIDHEMRRPDWDGLPDMDFLFAIGVFAEIYFVFKVLSPVTAAGVYLKWRHPRQISCQSERSTLGIALM